MYIVEKESKSRGTCANKVVTGPGVDISPKNKILSKIVILPQSRYCTVWVKIYKV